MLKARRNTKKKHKSEKKWKRHEPTLGVAELYIQNFEVVFLWAVEQERERCRNQLRLRVETKETETFPLWIMVGLYCIVYAKRTLYTLIFFRHANPCLLIKINCYFDVINLLFLLTKKISWFLSILKFLFHTFRQIIKSCILEPYQWHMIFNAS